MIVSEVISIVELHERMKAIQTDSDIKIKTLAAQFKISENVLGNYLNGRRAVPYDVLVKFAEYYQVTADYLLGLTEDPSKPLPLSRTERELILGFRTLDRSEQALLLRILNSIPAPEI